MCRVADGQYSRTAHPRWVRFVHAAPHTTLGLSHTEFRLPPRHRQTAGRATPRTSSERPVLYLKLRHRKVRDVRCGESCPNPDSRSSYQAIRLVKSDTDLGELAPPCAGTLSFGSTQWGQTEGLDQALRARLLLRVETSPDLLDRNDRHPRLHTAPSEPPHTTSGRPPPEGINQHCGVDEQSGQSQPDRRRSPRRWDRTQLAGSSSHS